MPLSRFNRDYLLTANGVAIRPPLRVSFSADKAVAGGLNKLTVRVYNLKESNRLALAKDAEEQRRVPITFAVGYSGELQQLFKGTVHRGKNFREGPDMVTELECLDGGFDYLNSFTSATVRGKGSAFDAILGDMPNTAKGKITAQEPLQRPRVLVGASGQLINGLVNDGQSWYIDNEQLFVIKTGDVVSRFTPVVSAATGLLNTPAREASKVTFSTLLNPTIRIAGLLDLVSATAPQMNGVYKAESISYIGDNYGADWSQTVTGILRPDFQVL